MKICAETKRIKKKQDVAFTWYLLKLYIFGSLTSYIFIIISLVFSNLVSQTTQQGKFFMVDQLYCNIVIIKESHNWYLIQMSYNQFQIQWFKILGRLKTLLNNTLNRFQYNHFSLLLPIVLSDTSLKKISFHQFAKMSSFKGNYCKMSSRPQYAHSKRCHHQNIFHQNRWMKLWSNIVHYNQDDINCNSKKFNFRNLRKISKNYTIFRVKLVKTKFWFGVFI